MELLLYAACDDYKSVLKVHDLIKDAKDYLKASAVSILYNHFLHQRYLSLESSSCHGSLTANITTTFEDCRTTKSSSDLHNKK